MNSSPSSMSLTDSNFHQLAEAIFFAIEAQVDEWLQKDMVDIDAQRTGGLLELTLPNASKLVINTQPPLHEVWLASVSGGYHFKYVQPHWLDSKSGKEFFDVLSASLAEQTGLPLKFNPTDT